MKKKTLPKKKITIDGPHLPPGTTVPGILGKLGHYVVKNIKKIFNK